MKYLLDTNVVSELRKVGDGNADLNVTTWLGVKDSRDLYISAVTISELERGVLSIQRRDFEKGSRLRAWMDSRHEADALIAATAIVHGLAVVTRNIHDFQGTGVVLVDPWRA